jgi:hypothetical protein
VERHFKIVFFSVKKKILDPSGNRTKQWKFDTWALSAFRASVRKSENMHFNIYRNIRKYGSSLLISKGKRQDLILEVSSLQKRQENPHVLPPYLAFISYAFYCMEVIYQGSVSLCNRKVPF